jgi:hypothetical protein
MYLNYCRELLGFRTLLVVPYSKSQRTQRFGNLICFHPQKKGEDTLLGPVERADLNPVILSIIHRRQNPLECNCCRGFYSVQ